MIRNVLTLTLFALVISLVSCKNDPEPAPQEFSANISLIDTVDSYVLFSTVALKIDAFAPARIRTASCNVWQGAEMLETIYTLDSTRISLSEEVRFILAPRYAGRSIDIVFSVQDELRNIIRDTVSLQVASSQIEFIAADTLSTYGNSKHASFYDIISPSSFYGVQLSKTAAKKSIDFIYYFTKTEKAILSNPASEGAETAWSTQGGGLWPLFGIENETKLYALTSEIDYEGITTGVELDNALAGKTAVNELKDLVEGQLIGFQLVEARGSKSGIIKINKVEGSTVATAKIAFEAKVAK